MAKWSDEYAPPSRHTAESMSGLIAWLLLCVLLSGAVLLLLLYCLARMGV
jgi:hypothetical protein